LCRRSTLRVSRCRLQPLGACYGRRRSPSSRRRHGPLSLKVGQVEAYGLAVLFFWFSSIKKRVYAGEFETQFVHVLLSWQEPADSDRGRRAAAGPAAADRAGASPAAHGTSRTSGCESGRRCQDPLSHGNGAARRACSGAAEQLLGCPRVPSPRWRAFPCVCLAPSPCLARPGTCLTTSPRRACLARALALAPSQRLVAAVGSGGASCRKPATTGDAPMRAARTGAHAPTMDLKLNPDLNPEP